MQIDLSKVANGYNQHPFDKEPVADSGQGEDRAAFVWLPGGQKYMNFFKYVQSYRKRRR